mmetsp:Transcript_31400/g.52995  ORF Transcript_31400/g.52995 Transcript_31400/m.52995 type:complete len:160 (+) Transcript_31400:131-610(+)
MRIYLRDENKSFVDLFHFLKLYPTDGTSQTVKKPVVSEFYDEIVFPVVSEEIAIKLSTPPQATPAASIFNLPIGEHFLRFSEDDDLNRIEAARAAVRRKYDESMQLCNTVQTELKQYKKLTGQQGGAPVAQQSMPQPQQPPDVQVWPIAPHTIEGQQIV